MSGETKRTVTTTTGSLEVTDEQIAKRDEKIDALGKAHKAAGTVTETPADTLAAPSGGAAMPASKSDAG